MVDCKYIQKNQLAIGIFIFTFLISIISCLGIGLEFDSKIGLVIALTILGLLIVLFIFFVWTGKISRIKIDNTGLYIRKKTTVILFEWTQLIDIKVEKVIKIIKNAPMLKIVFYYNENFCTLLTQEYILDNLFKYCTDKKVIEKLRDIKLLMKKN